MTQSVSLDGGVRRIFWGYLLLAVDFSLNINFGVAFSLPLLPDVLGWALLWWGITGLSPWRPSLGLLKPFCVVLGVSSLTQFFPTLDTLLPGWLDLLLAIMTLYAHFQLLTDVAALGEELLGRQERAQNLRRARTVIVVIQTAMYCYDLLLRLPVWAGALVAVNLCAHLYLLVQLWGLSRELGE